MDLASRATAGFSRNVASFSRAVIFGSCYLLICCVIVADASGAWTLLLCFIAGFLVFPFAGTHAGVQALEKCQAFLCRLLSSPCAGWHMFDIGLSSCSCVYGWTKDFVCFHFWGSSLFFGHVGPWHLGYGYGPPCFAVLVWQGVKPAEWMVWGVVYILLWYLLVVSIFFVRMQDCTVFIYICLELSPASYSMSSLSCVLALWPFLLIIACNC